MWFRIRCTSRFNADFRIIKNNLKGCFFLFLVHAGRSNPEGPILISLLTLQDKAKIIINFIIFNKQHLTRKCTISMVSPLVEGKYILLNIPLPYPWSFLAADYLD